MADTNPHPSFPDLEGYTPLPDESQSQRTGANSSKLFKASLIILFGILLLGSSVVFVSYHGSKAPAEKPLISSSSSSSISPETTRPLSKGVSEGVSEKWFLLFSGKGIPFPWNHSELSWQRTAYHLQTQTNYISDPDGPIFYKGWYHVFYQYNPYRAKWGNITWGHSVSRDLIHWLYLPVAVAPDQWYDINGVFSGSISILPDGRIVMLYTGATTESVQVQNLAYPANLSDPLLVEWVKYPGNPVLVPPPGIGIKDFRDPSTAWNDSDGAWQITIGSRANKTGISFVYRTNDFINYELLDGLLHAVNGTGMWECMDLYPVALTGDNGLDMSATGPGVKHVLKASLDDTKIDYYSIGSYDRRTKKWTPDNPDVDVGIGLRYDWGPRYYASRSFYDQKKQRRVLWGWIGETDSEEADLEKGWASLETIPRTVLLDQKTRTNILQWPVEEVESLRLSSKEFSKVKVGPGSVVPLELNTASQLDIVAEFEIDKGALEVEADVGYKCNTSQGAAGRGVLGPFGLLVIATENLSEETPVYFYIAKGSDGNLKTFFCADNLRSSKAGDLYSRIYGSTVPVLEGEKLQMRLLVDHSIVESFAQGGRTLITWRVYPTEAIYEAARVFLFNNATGASITASVKVWEMNSAFLHPFRAE